MSIPLWATVADLMESLAPRGDAAERLRIDRVTVDLPLEVTFRAGPGGVEVMGAPPGWRFRTPFDLPAGRLRLEIGREAPADPYALHTGEAP